MRRRDAATGRTAPSEFLFYAERQYRESFGDTNTWHTLTNLVLPASPWVFVDTRAAGPRRFYRAVAE